MSASRSIATVVAYVTEGGSVRQPSGRDPKIGWWWAAAVKGYGLGNYRRADGTVGFVVQDRCPSERSSLGMTNREVAWLNRATHVIA